MQVPMTAGSSKSSIVEQHLRITERMCASLFAEDEVYPTIYVTVKSLLANICPVFDHPSSYPLNFT